jgi:hypothetical protein
VDTEKKKQPELIYSAETTARSRENSPPDVSAYQTAQITNNSRKLYENNYNTRETLPVCTQKEKPR